MPGSLRQLGHKGVESILVKAFGLEFGELLLVDVVDQITGQARLLNSSQLGFFVDLAAMGIVVIAQEAAVLLVTRVILVGPEAVGFEQQLVSFGAGLAEITQALVLNDLQEGIALLNDVLRIAAHLLGQLEKLKVRFEIGQELLDFLLLFFEEGDDVVDLIFEPGDLLHQAAEELDQLGQELIFEISDRPFSFALHQLIEDLGHLLELIEDRFDRRDHLLDFSDLRPDFALQLSERVANLEDFLCMLRQNARKFGQGIDQDRDVLVELVQSVARRQALEGAHRFEGVLDEENDLDDAATDLLNLVAILAHEVVNELLHLDLDLIDSALDRLFDDGHRETLGGLKAFFKDLLGVGDVVLEADDDGVGEVVDDALGFVHHGVEGVLNVGRHVDSHVANAFTEGDHVVDDRLVEGDKAVLDVVGQLLGGIRSALTKGDTGVLDFFDAIGNRLLDVVGELFALAVDEFVDGVGNLFGVALEAFAGALEIADDARSEQTDLEDQLADSEDDLALDQGDLDLDLGLEGLGLSLEVLHHLLRRFLHLLLDLFDRFLALLADVGDDGGVFFVVVVDEFFFSVGVSVIALALEFGGLLFGFSDHLVLSLLDLAVEFVAQVFDSAVDARLGGIKAGFEGFFGTRDDVVHGVADALHRVVAEVADTIEHAGDRPEDAVTGKVDQLEAFVANRVDGVVDGIEALVDQVLNILGQFLSKADGFVQGVIKGGVDLVDRAVDELLQHVGELLHEGEDFLEDLVDHLDGGVDEGIDALEELLGSFVQKFHGRVGHVLHELVELRRDRLVPGLAFVIFLEAVLNGGHRLIDIARQLVLHDIGDRIAGGLEAVAHDFDHLVFHLGDLLFGFFDVAFDRLGSAFDGFLGLLDHRVFGRHDLVADHVRNFDQALLNNAHGLFGHQAQFGHDRPDAHVDKADRFFDTVDNLVLNFVSGVENRVDAALDLIENAIRLLVNGHEGFKRLRMCEAQSLIGFFPHLRRNTFLNFAFLSLIFSHPSPPIY